MASIAALASNAKFTVRTLPPSAFLALFSVLSAAFLSELGGKGFRPEVRSMSRELLSAVLS